MTEQKSINYQDLLKRDYQVILNYLKAKFPLFHNSNLFLRDFQYGVKRFLEKKEIYLNSAEAEKATLLLSNYLEEKGVLIPVNRMGWKLNYPEFVTDKPGDPL